MKIKSTLKRVDKGFDKFRAAYKALGNRSHVNVGILGNIKNTRKNEDGAELTNVEIGAIHEFGSPAERIPERSFLRSTMKLNRAAYMRTLRATVRDRVLQGKATMVQVLNAMGARIANDIKNRITQGAGIPPPLSPQTIARKGSSRPLVDTGQLVNSITWAVVTEKDAE